MSHQDLDSIVAKYRFAPYTSQRELSSFIKIKNRNYNQIIGREDHFADHEPQPGWERCATACAGAK